MTKKKTYLYLKDICNFVKIFVSWYFKFTWNLLNYLSYIY